MHPEGDNEEVEIPKQKDQPGGAGVPPGVIPGKRADLIEQHFHKNTKSRASDGYRQSIGNSQDLGLFIWKQHLSKRDPRNCEHEADLDVEAY